MVDHNLDLRDKHESCRTHVKIHIKYQVWLDLANHAALLRFYTTAFKDNLVYALSVYLEAKKCNNVNLKINKGRAVQIVLF